MAYSQDMNKVAGAGFYPAEVGAVDQKITAVEMAESALERGRQLSIHIQSLADRILGPQPTPLGKQGETEPSRSGVFPLLQSSSERTQAIISEGFEAINRIERSLP